MGRPVKIDLATGAGSSTEFLMGTVTVESTTIHYVGNTLVLPDPVDLPLFNGAVTHPDMAPSPDGPEPVWAYKFTFTSGITGRSWSQLRGVPVGTNEVNYKDLPLFQNGPNAEDLAPSVEYLVKESLANDPTVMEAVNVALSNADIVLRSDVGIPVAQPTDSEEAYYSATADASGNIVEAVRHDGIKAFPRAEMGGAVTEYMESTDYVKATTDEAGNLWEDALDLNGKVPDWVLAEWSKRMDVASRSGWEDKTILVLGTSITARPGGFVDQLGPLLGANVINKGEGSSGIVWDYSKESRGKSLSATVAELSAATGGSAFAEQSYEQRVIPYLNGTLATADHVHIDHAYNDRGYTLGTIDSTDKSTFFGAMNFVLGRIVATKPDVTISFQTPPSLYTPYGQGFNAGTSEKRDAILALSRKWGAKVYDVTLESQLSDAQAGTWITDTVHPNESWHAFIAPRVASFFKTITPSTI